MPIDWTATGSMLTGVGTLASAVAIGTAAMVGRNTFDLWRRQRQEERRIDAAEKIMTLAYRLKDDLEPVRRPMIQAYELEAARENLEKNDEWWSGLTDVQKRRATVGQAILQRIERHPEDWQDIWALKPLALAYFGAPVDHPLLAFWRMHAEVTNAAIAYREADWEDDPSFSQQLRAKMTSSAKDDVMGGNIASAVAKLEEELLPVLRAGHKIPRVQLRTN